MTSLFKKIRAFYGGLVDFCGAAVDPAGSFKDVIPPKPEHPPIKTSEMRKRVVAFVDEALLGDDFTRPRKHREIWIRPRTSKIHDHIRLQFESTPSMGRLEVRACFIGFDAPEVGDIYVKVLKAIHKKSNQSPREMEQVFTTRLLNKYGNKIKTWIFWGTAFSEATMQDLVNDIKALRGPFFSQVSSYEELEHFVSQRKPRMMKNLNWAIIYLLLERKEKAVQLLEALLPLAKASTRLSIENGTKNPWPYDEIVKYLLEQINSGDIKKLLQSP